MTSAEEKEVQRLVQMLCVTGLTDTQSSVKLMVPQTVRQKLNGYFRFVSDRLNRTLPHAEASVQPMIC